MVPNLFLLIYVTSDYIFSNNYLIYEGNKKEFQNAFLWTILVAAGLTFDLLTTLKGSLIVSSFVALLIVGLFLKKGKNTFKNYVMAEMFNFVVAIVFTLPLSRWITSVSYLRPPFVNYLLGILVASVVLTDIMKRVGWIEPRGGADENFERGMLFIFVMAGQWWYTSITIVAMLLYRLIRYRKPSKLWILNPAIGILVTAFWYVLMQKGWI